MLSLYIRGGFTVVYKICSYCVHIYSSEFTIYGLLLIFFVNYSGKFHYNTLKSETLKPSISSDTVNFKFLDVIKASIFSLKLA